MKKFYKIVSIYVFLLITISCSGPEERTPTPQLENNTEKTKVEPKVIYGDDNRLDLYEVTNSDHLRVARSTVALVKPDDLEDIGSSYQLNTSSYGGTYGLCSDEPFYEQETMAFCSGFLVGKNLVVTAGHCIQSQSDCNSVKFVFGFSVNQEGVLPQQVSKSEVYSCKTLVAQKLEGSGADYAVVQLDRDVNNHDPLRIRRSDEVYQGEGLYVVGHPVGLPTKVAHDASVRSLASEYFVANLDTFGGNSGSAVFNAQTHEVEGILVRGEADFEFSRGCRASKVCTNSGCRGEDVTKISQVLSYVPELPVTEEPPPVEEEEEEEEEVEEPEAPPEEPLENRAYTSYETYKIPDYSVQGVSSALFVDEGVKGRNVTVQVHITHTWRGDLKVRLKAPSGKVLTLQNRKGRNLDNVIGEYGVSLESEDDLSQLSDEGLGTWELIVSDHARFDNGQLNAWRIKLNLP